MPTPGRKTLNAQPVRPDAASASVTAVTRSPARRSLAIAVLLAALPAALAGPAMAESPAEILKWALKQRPCAPFETAQGWESHRASPLSDLTHVASQSIVVVDRSRRRFVSLTRMTPAAPDTWRVTRQAYADGQFFTCTAENSETCRLEPKSRDQVTADDVTGAYVIFGDLHTAFFGGAAISLATVPPEIATAKWAISLTPQGGLPYILYIEPDGTVIATDMPGPDRTQRFWMSDQADMGGCTQPLTARIEILPHFAGKFIEWRLESFEYRSVMSPDDTRFE